MDDMRIGRYMSDAAKQRCAEELSPVAAMVLNMRSRKFTAKALDVLDTVIVGHECNCKVDTGSMRIWLSRLTTLDDAPYDNQITVEVLRDGTWLTVDTYAGGAV
tara:strand:- start:176 stop:487 length:312 start_codon:yes stop_codon:yes gene_type:complete